MTQFQAMGETQRRQWLQWCNSHDWGQGEQRARYKDLTGELVTYGGEFDAAGNYSIVETCHKSPRALRDWAGY